jgi:radical SAM superfamily enzyme YgiQ (UPF0313 family)
MTKLVLVNAGKEQHLAMWEPQNLLILAAYAKKFGHEVIIADQSTGENIFKKIKTFNPDFVGITGTTAVIFESYKIGDWCRKEGFKVIMGGVHVTVMPDEGIKHADYVVVGEGEDALVKILSGKAQPGIVKGEFIKNIDELPKIDRDLIDMKFYSSAMDRVPGSTAWFVGPGTKICSILATRGCPYNCIYCHNSWRGLPVRMRSARSIIDEMKELKTKYGIKAIFFMDDDFLVSKQRIFEFCKLYKEEGIDIVWQCGARVTAVDPEILEAIKSANCKQISYGLESGSPRILGILKNNRTTVEQNAAAIKMAKEAGLFATGTFMIGNPTETEEDIEMTKKFIIDNNVDEFAVSIATPFPGTKMWEMCKEKGVIPDEIDWSKFNYRKLTVMLCDVPPERIDYWFKEFSKMIELKHPNMRPKRALMAAIKNPIKAIEVLFKRPEVVAIIIKRIFAK